MGLCVYKVNISKNLVRKVIVVQPVRGGRKQKHSIISKSPGCGMDASCIYIYVRSQVTRVSVRVSPASAQSFKQI